MHELRATKKYAQAIEATADLLGKLRIESMFVGSVAESVWLGTEVARGSVDALVLMNAPQKSQVAMMASNRGFRVDRDELDATEELDLVPLNFITDEGEVRVHVLLATNALYGRMFASACEAQFGEHAIKVPSAEDLALLLLVAEDEDAVKELTLLPGFDRQRWNDRLEAIGLGMRVARG
jgi:hypothetical protein